MHFLDCLFASESLQQSDENILAHLNFACAEGVSITMNSEPESGLQQLLVHRYTGESVDYLSDTTNKFLPPIHSLIVMHSLERKGKRKLRGYCLSLGIITVVLFLFPSSPPAALGWLVSPNVQVLVFGILEAIYPSDQPVWSRQPASPPPSLPSFPCMRRSSGMV